MADSSTGKSDPSPQPLFDAASAREMVLALGRAAAASLASGIAISTGEPQTLEATLRIQREVYAAFTSLAYRDPAMPVVAAPAEEEPAAKVLAALDRFGAAAIAAGVIGSSGQRQSIGDAMRTFARVMETMRPITRAGVGRD
jgi:hypothetical protein